MTRKTNGTPMYKRCLSGLAIAALMAIPASSLAATANSALIKGGALNLRETASTAAKVLGQYPTGTLVTVYSEADGWAKVTINGQSGYVMAKYLNSAFSSSTATVRTNSDRGLNLREEPSTNGAIITSYKTGTTVTVLQKSAAWSRVSIDGKEGFMASQYLRFGSSGGGSGSGSGSTITVGTVNNPRPTQVLNLRQTPSLDAKVLAYYRNGVQVDVLSIGSTWLEVRVNGLHGYMMKQYVKLSDNQKPDVETPFEATLKNPNGGSIVNFRSAPGLNTNVIKTYPVGTKVTVLEMGENWSKVTINGQEGYVSSYFLKF